MNVDCPAVDTTIFNDGSLYDAQYATLTRDIHFYQQLAIQSGGPVLELAIGTGRIAYPILQSGIAVTGLDLSHAMLMTASERTRALHTPCRLVQGDYRDFNLNETFPLVFCAFNALLHLFTKDAFLQMLHCVKSHLRPGGLFAFDIFQPDPNLLKNKTMLPELRERFYDERTQQACDLLETHEYDHTTQIKICHWEYRWADGTMRQETLKIRVYFPDELKLLLDQADLQVVRHLGDFNSSAFGSTSPKQILVCRTGKS